jgi:AcrR family transcriptional regulator
MKERSKISSRRKSILAGGKAKYKNTRDEIVKAASNVFRQKGYKSTTLTDIAEEAGVERATLYYYVGGKEELFREAVQDVVDKNAAEALRVSRDSSLTPGEKLEYLVHWLMSSYEEHYPHLYVYIQEEMHQVTGDTSEWGKNMVKHTKRWEAIVIKLIEEGIEQGEFRSDVPPLLLANSLFGMFNWTHRWFKPGKRSAKEIATAFCKVFFQGVQVRSRKAGDRSPEGYSKSLAV